MGPPHAQPGQPTAQPYPSPMSAPASFSLRAASWDQSAKNDMGIHRPDSDPSACRYPSNAVQHPMYHDAYVRPVRPGEESPAYSMQSPGWHNSPEPANQAYVPSQMSPPMTMYSDERTAISGEAIQKNYPQQQPHAHYEQDMSAQPPYAAVNGYFPMLLQDAASASNPSSPAWQTAERASVRLAARGTVPMPMQLHPQLQRSQASPPQAYYSAPMAFAMPYPTPQPMPTPKRQLESPEESDSKSKKSKTRSKVTDNAASSRRGYNAKKRNEAAQIAAQNAQLIPSVSYAHVSSEKGKEKASSGSSPGTMKLVSDDGLPHPEASGPLHPELQFARCMSNRYRSEEFPRCVSCTRRWAGDTCRFQGIRFFLKNDKKHIVGISFVESQKPDSPTMNFPLKWNIPLEKSHIRRIKRTVASALLQTLKKELEHLSLPEVIRRTRESEVRATCDTCMTSIFSSSWMCRLCGREACAECFEQVKELTIDRDGAPDAEIAALQARRERHAHVNPFFLSCTRRNEHQAKDFSPMSRFCRSELEEAITEMEALLQESDQDALAPDSGAFNPPLTAARGDASDWSMPAPMSMSGRSAVMLPNMDYPAPRGFSGPVNGGIPPDPSSFAAGTLSTPQSAAGFSSIPSHDTLRFADSQLTDDLFRSVWTKGEPLVVTGLQQKFRIQWTPQYFTSKYGTQSCLILECQTDQNKRVTVGEFFSWFGKYEGRRDCWKLKDWPPTTDFRTSFPELYDDFGNATPVPNYVRRDGVLNLASHFPSNTVAPDLGPKMYNAMASFESLGSKGTTRLHMDMADAVNVMLYAADTPDGRPGCAAWDLFQAEDSSKVRKFLRKKFKGQFQHDPIHSQQFYLDSTLRQELFKEYGVKSHRIYQRPGEAVFIPAGCAHQVCNLADCIKVASDFVSPENIGRCEMLTREFREQNQSMAWKEDVLQLRTMMWFAWLSCCRQEKDMDS